VEIEEERKARKQARRAEKATAMAESDSPKKKVKKSEV